MDKELTFPYQKKRSEFGKQCLFSDRGPDLIDNYPANRKLFKNYILKDPIDRSQQCAPIQAEHYVNTITAEYSTNGVNHIEGGWPKDVNMFEEEQTKRYRRKIEKDEGFQHTILQLCKSMENCILQNNAINIYQQYFSDLEPTPLTQKNSGRTVNVFQDQMTPVRPVTNISWSPDNHSKLAVCHANLTFQTKDPIQTQCYIWNVNNPNVPLLVLKPEFQTIRLEYHQKDPHSLVSGQINGQVAVWDVRRGQTPVDTSALECSFRDPVLDVLWINSKSGTEFFSSSTDGQVKWWDTRKLSEPTETLILHYAKEEDQRLECAQGASCLEYESTIPTKYMVGTEDGMIIVGNRKGKLIKEKMAARYQAHMGPVLAVHRNPGFLKNFLTIGDWRARIWAEDCKESSVMWTSFHKARLTDGAWNPARLSVFFTTRSDGILDVWDILQQQNSACLSIKVCDDSLKTIRPHENGRLLALGSDKGKVYLVQLSENLSILNKNDKVLLTAMFEREGKREKILEARNRELRLKRKVKATAPGIQTDGMGEAEGEVDGLIDESLFENSSVKQAEDEFYLAVAKNLPAGEEQSEEEGQNEDA